MRPYRVALTGGPCAGKTTVTEALNEEYGSKILIVPETASMLLNNGFPNFGRDISFNLDALYRLQDTIYNLQLNIEPAYEQQALEQGVAFILLDRGMLDAAAYVPGGLDEYLARYSLRLEDVVARYDMVIHLESVGTANPNLYESLKGTNPARYETLDQVIEREMLTRAVWQAHPNWRFVSGQNGIKAVIAQVTNMLSQHLDVEIEIKYLLKNGLPQIDLGTGVYVQQGYLRVGNSEIRIRKMGEEAFITIKSAGTYRRREWERSLPLDLFEQLWEDTKGHRIEKTRYFVPYETWTLEIDEYHGHLTPRKLVTMEVEFKTEDEIAQFVLPPWAKDAEDVTKDRSYSNSSLAG